jgi:hypothetical protein
MLYQKAVRQRNQEPINPNGTFTATGQNLSSSEHNNKMFQTFSHSSTKDKHSMFPVIHHDHVLDPVVHHENVIASSSQGSKADKSIDLAPFQEMDQELVLTPPILQHSGTPKEKIFLNGSSHNNVTSQQANPVNARPILRQYNRTFSCYIQNLSQWVLKIGGLTFIVYNIKSTLYFLVINYKLDWAVYSMLKLECLMSLLAWYWISMDEHIRQTTDNMYVSGLKKVLTLRIWPLRVRSWAAQLEVVV